MSKIVLSLAMSLDGYISDVDGGFEWIVGHGGKQKDFGKEFDFDEFLDSVDTIVMGSKAYEDCVLTGMNDFLDKKILVATTRNLESRSNVEFISGNITEAILKIQNGEEKDIFIFGGAGVSAPFINENIIDKYIIGLIPCILGNGRPLFNQISPKIDLFLDDISVNNGVTMLTYSKKQDVL